MIIPTLLGPQLKGLPDVVSLQNAINRFSPLSGILLVVDGDVGRNTLSAGLWALSIAESTTQTSSEYTPLFQSGIPDPINSNAAAIADFLNSVAEQMNLPFVAGASGGSGGAKQVPKTIPTPPRPPSLPGTKAGSGLNTNTLLLLAGLVVGGAALWYISSHQKKGKK